jgi:hypothetical protein
MKAQTGTTIGLVRFSLGIEPPGFPLGTLLSLQSSLALSSTGLFTNQHGGLQDLSIFASWESEFGILGSVCIELPLQHWMLGLECRYDRVFCHPRHFSSLITGLRVGRNIHW